MTASETIFRHALTAGIVLSLAACAEDPPPVSVYEFMENPRLLEATMVRCGQNRAEMKYEAECVNARDAVNRLAAAEEQARRQELERQSERKRQALRRTQQAAAEARRRAEEEQRRLEEEQYLGIFSEDDARVVDGGEPQIAPGAGNAPRVEEIAPTELSPTPEAQAPESSAADGDLGAIREELRRRQESPPP